MLKPKYKMWHVFDQPIGTFVSFFVCVVRILHSIRHKKRLRRADLCCRSVIKEFAHALVVRRSSYGCTWEVWRALKMQGFLSAAPRATLTHFSCSPNFPRACITRFIVFLEGTVTNLAI